MFRRILGLAIVCSVVSMLYVTIYFVGQHSLRMGANDPQIQMAEDLAGKLDQGSRPSDLAPATIDPSKSLSPFVIVYDLNGREEASSVSHDGHTPELPGGVLKAANSGHENRLTWQPRTDVRIAAVVVAAQNHYVVAGRSLREVESRESDVQIAVMIAWVASLLTVAAAYMPLSRRRAS